MLSPGYVCEGCLHHLEWCEKTLAESGGHNSLVWGPGMDSSRESWALSMKASISLCFWPWEWRGWHGLYPSWSCELKENLLSLCRILSEYFIRAPEREPIEKSDASFTGNKAPVSSVDLLTMACHHPTRSQGTGWVLWRAGITKISASILLCVELQAPGDHLAGLEAQVGYEDAIPFLRGKQMELSTASSFCIQKSLFPKTLRSFQWPQKQPHPVNLRVPGLLPGSKAWDGA